MRIGHPIDTFDYRVGCDDFFLYELGRLIDEERASLEDDEFRRLIDAGIHEHIERRLEIRAEIAARLRKLDTIPKGIVHVVEDIEAPLRDVPLIVQSYAAYLLRKLEACDPETACGKLAGEEVHEGRIHAGAGAVGQRHGHPRVLGAVQEQVRLQGSPVTFGRREAWLRVPRSGGALRARNAKPNVVVFL